MSNRRQTEAQFSQLKAATLFLQQQGLLYKDNKNLTFCHVFLFQMIYVVVTAILYSLRNVTLCYVHHISDSNHF